jgi:hypothetical protein
MNNDDEEFRQQATNAENQARAAKNEIDRAAWMRIAQGWLSLLRKRPQSEDDSEPK